MLYINFYGNTESRSINYGVRLTKSSLHLAEQKAKFAQLTRTLNSANHTTTTLFDTIIITSKTFHEMAILRHFALLSGATIIYVYFVTNFSSVVEGKVTKCTDEEKVKMEGYRVG